MGQQVIDPAVVASVGQLGNRERECPRIIGDRGDLFDRSVALPQYSGTKQKLLEVFVQRLTSTDYSISARGIVYPFDAKGFLDTKALALEGSREISRFRSVETNIFDLNPSLKRRRFQKQYTWKPSKTMLDDVWSDIEPGRAKKRRLPVFTAP